MEFTLTLDYYQLFYSICGALIGAIIGGIIAYYIARHQVNIEIKGRKIDERKLSEDYLKQIIIEIKTNNDRLKSIISTIESCPTVVTYENWINVVENVELLSYSMYDSFINLGLYRYTKIEKMNKINDAYIKIRSVSSTVKNNFDMYKELRKEQLPSFYLDHRNTVLRLVRENINYIDSVLSEINKT